MKKGLLAILTAATLAVGGGVFVASGTAFAYTICNSTINGPVTLTGPVVVPKGANCNLQTVTVTGSVQVQSGGTLVIGSGSHIEGSVQSNRPGSNAGNPSATDSITSYSIVLCTSTIDGPVQISDAPAAVVIGASGCGSGDTINSSGTNGSTGVSLTGNAGPTYLDNNTITGSVGVSSNKLFTEISSNTISGNLSCTANTPAPTGGSNTVTGSKNAQCSAL